MIGSHHGLRITRISRCMAFAYYSRKPSMALWKSSRPAKFWYTLANRRYATTSKSRNGFRMALPTSSEVTSARPRERRSSSTFCPSSFQILFSDRPPLTSFAYAGNHFVSTEWLHATRTFSDQQHTGFHRGKTLAAFRAYATPTDGMTVIANARINDFGVGVLAKRTMHAPQNNVYGRKNHAARVSFTQPEQ